MTHYIQTISITDTAHLPEAVEGQITLEQYIQILKKNYQPRIQYLNINIKTFPDKQKLRKSIASRLALKEVFGMKGSDTKW